MEYILLAIIIAGVLLNSVFIFFLFRKKTDSDANSLKCEIEKTIEWNNKLGDQIQRNISDNIITQRAQIEELNRRFVEVINTVDKRLFEMKEVVDEKLSSTLETRLNRSFIQMNERLDTLQKGLGEMNSLAGGVDDLKKLLGNVKTRGTWGEVQLEALLSQMLSPQQYLKEVSTKVGSSERVEFAIVMPGKSGDSVWLPIDAKFPIEDYMRIVEASESGNVGLIEEASKRLENNILLEAKKISEKYINPPTTTDFAIMYLPIEGLYAEVLRRGNVASVIQQKFKVTICGPTTLGAMINSLQMGFRTLAIEKRSAEVWQVLSTFKTEFARFCELLERTQKQIGAVSNTIESATMKTRTIQRKLRGVEALENAKENLSLPSPSGEEVS
ncbi:MAG: DNA recombination protein RmuC [Firmicutes bacterium]|nr:DNA recombination protein RmuC [Bacillota bacterium]